ncbi:leucine--tRNA ligase, cytoplasmic-like isoform X2 [Corticium candelabrum]|nr:leucine--tRNA ligase, cytoplasmic-like isoform X2 [Corticium candelabrum]
MAEFGTPPVFPQLDAADTGQGQKVKSKVAMKTGNLKYQWQIMEALGLSKDKIPAFADAAHWLEHFPVVTEADLRSMGLKVDWRRSFITTDANPYYDSFVRWHFLTLKDRDRVKFGKRYTIYSVKDGQPTMDHDRSEGEGVGPQEYTLIKMKLLEPLPEKLKFLSSSPTFLVAATLRPETMYGQTNCYIGPTLEYIAFKAKNGEVFISTKRAATNMAYQGMTAEEEKVDVLTTLSGMDLMGVALKAPLTSYDKIYTLPMLTVKADKGTGVVTSVPSDAPDDFAALQDLKNKDTFRQKYGIRDDMVLPFEPIAIIRTGEFGDLSAPKCCELMKIKSQNDHKQLAEAKEKVYKAGFYDGVMTIGHCKGQKVQVVKKVIQKLMIDNDEAVLYHEPEGRVVSRSGDECIVALCDQWYLDYGNEEWKEQTRKLLDNVNTYSDEVRRNFLATLDWLESHACSRSYGLGTKLPWDTQYLIEALSDSTIYMAYYTVSHLLQGAVNGSKPGPLGIKPEQLTKEVWDYIFFRDAPRPVSDITDEAFVKLRQEFQFWYPLDLRVSGKDLVPNHLTYLLYNHLAVWDKYDDRWPKAIRANGHILLNSEKMAKSTGNFLTLQQAVEKFGADAMRFNLADAGDSIEDANFVEKHANATILRLHGLVDWTKEALASLKQHRENDELTFYDRVFESEINQAILQTVENYENMLFRGALKTGVFELQSARDHYRERADSGRGMHRDIVQRYIEVQALLLCPICPHVAEHMWRLLGKSGSIMNALLPVAGEVDVPLIESAAFLRDCAHNLRIKIRNLTEKNPGQKPQYATIYVAELYPPWQAAVLKCLQHSYNEETGEFQDNKTISLKLKDIPEVKKFSKKAMPFAQMVKENVNHDGVAAMNSTTSFDQVAVLKQNKAFLEQSVELFSIQVVLSSEGDQRAIEESMPGKPYSILHFTDPQPHVMVQFANPEVASGHFSLNVAIHDGDTVETVIEAIRKIDGKLGASQPVHIFRYNDPVAGPRKIPKYQCPDDGKSLLVSGSVFHITSDGQLAVRDPNAEVPDDILVGNNMCYHLTYVSS